MDILLSNSRFCHLPSWEEKESHGVLVQLESPSGFIYSVKRYLTWEDLQADLTNICLNYKVDIHELPKVPCTVIVHKFSADRYFEKLRSYDSFTQTLQDVEQPEIIDENMIIEFNSKEIQIHNFKWMQLYEIKSNCEIQRIEISIGGNLIYNIDLQYFKRSEYSYVFPVPLLFGMCTLHGCRIKFISPDLNIQGTLCGKEVRYDRFCNLNYLIPRYRTLQQSSGLPLKGYYSQTDQPDYIQLNGIKCKLTKYGNYYSLDQMDDSTLDMSRYIPLSRVEYPMFTQDPIVCFGATILHLEREMAGLWYSGH